MTKKDEISEHPTTVQIADAGLFSFLSHDIRSSFSELSSGLNALSYTTQDPKSRKDIQQLIAASDHLGRLLRDALTMVVGEHAIQPPEFGDTNVKEFLTILVLRWGKIVAARGSVLEFDASDSLPESVQIDVLAVERILSNLVSNAARHAKGGKINLHADYSDTDGLYITLRDHGEGFTPSQLETLFDFPPAPVGAGEPGSGYGLRIAHSLCARMGGTLAARNAADGGALLTLTLPIVEHPDTDPILSRDTVKALLKGRSALVVDDGAVHRLSLRAQLEALEMIVTEADGGIEAIEILEQKSFDLLFLDIEMPIFSGIDLLHALKERNIDLPATIGVTAHAFERNHAVIKEAGALIVLNKPVSNSTYLHSAILSALQLAKPDAPQSQPQSQSQDTRTTGTTDTTQQARGLETLIEMLNPSARHKFLKQLDDDLTTRLAEARTLAAKQMTDSDKQAMSRAAHALAGLFATSYVPAAHHKALHLERIVFSAPRSEVIALLDTLGQDVIHIKNTIHLLKAKK